MEANEQSLQNLHIDYINTFSECPYGKPQDMTLNIYKNPQIQVNHFTSPHLVYCATHLEQYSFNPIETQQFQKYHSSAVAVQAAPLNLYNYSAPLESKTATKFFSSSVITAEPFQNHDPVFIKLDERSKNEYFIDYNPHCGNQFNSSKSPVFFNLENIIHNSRVVPISQLTPIHSKLCNNSNYYIINNFSTDKIDPPVDINAPQVYLQPYSSTFPCSVIPQPTQPEPYFLIEDNPAESRKPLNKKFQGVHNNGLDNEDYDYICCKNDVLYFEEEQLCYKILDLIGYGTFGHVYRCIESSINFSTPCRIVALKIIKNLNHYHNQALSEVKILSEISSLNPQDTQGFVKMFGHFYYNNHLCIITEILQENMYQTLKKTQFNGLDIKYVQQISAQLIKNISILEEIIITHGDIKPENVLIEKIVEIPCLAKTSHINNSFDNHSPEVSTTFQNFVINDNQNAGFDDSLNSISDPCSNFYSSSNKYSYCSYHEDSPFLIKNNVKGPLQYESSTHQSQFTLDPNNRYHSTVQEKIRFNSIDEQHSYTHNGQITPKNISAFEDPTLSGNIIPNSFIKIKLIDFGSAHTQKTCMLSYIQSRFYRAPEVLLGLPSDCAVDMWSLGCVTFELLAGLPLFPGSSEFDQIQRITRIIGYPPSWMIENGQHANKYFYKVKKKSNCKHSSFNHFPCHFPHLLKDNHSSEINTKHPISTHHPYSSNQHHLDFRKYQNNTHHQDNFENSLLESYEWTLYTQAEFENMQQKIESPNQEYFKMNSFDDILDPTNPSFSWLHSAPQDYLHNCVDFLKKCLTIDPNNRLKPSAALHHPFIHPVIKLLNSYHHGDFLAHYNNPSPNLSSASTTDLLRSFSPSLSSSTQPSPLFHSKSYPVNFKEKICRTPNQDKNFEIISHFSPNSQNHIQHVHQHPRTVVQSNHSPPFDHSLDIEHTSHTIIHDTSGTQMDPMSINHYKYYNSRNNDDLNILNDQNQYFFQSSPNKSLPRLDYHMSPISIDSTKFNSMEFSSSPLILDSNSSFTQVDTQTPQIINHCNQVGHYCGTIGHFKNTESCFIHNTYLHQNISIHDPYHAHHSNINHIDCSIESTPSTHCTRCLSVFEFSSPNNHHSNFSAHLSANLHHQNMKSNYTHNPNESANPKEDCYECGLHQEYNPHLIPMTSTYSHVLDWNSTQKS